MVANEPCLGLCRGMSIRFVIAVTDGDWFEFLRQRPGFAELNFWAPSGSPFRALTPGELFLFKLHSPRNFIVGGGVFAYATSMPCSLAWEAFGEANGAGSMRAMRARIARYRQVDQDDREDFVIGCRILTQPFFFAESDWLPAPRSWARNIVSFKGYSTDDAEGIALWNAVYERMERSRSELLMRGPDRYGEPQLIRPRLGQGAFRLVVTDIYERRCAVTQERTLPALEAAHIRPYADGGEHEPSNGLLLRRDIHGLFDRGYVTVTPDLRFEVSRRIKEEFENGRHYYALHGQKIALPKEPRQYPDPIALEWHNENRYLG